MASMTEIGALRRRAGFPQGIMLLLPITMAVMGVLGAHTGSALAAGALPECAQLRVSRHGWRGDHASRSGFCCYRRRQAGLADRYGRRRVLDLVHGGLRVCWCCSPVVLNSLYAVIVSRAGVGICEAVVMTVSTTLISDYFKGRARERWLASQTAVASVSALGIIYLGGQLGAAYGWRGPFYLYVYSLVLVLGVITLTWEPTAEERSSAPGAAADSAEYQTFPWWRLIGICAVTLLGSISFYTVITKNAEALVALGVSGSGPHRHAVHARDHRRAAGYVHLLGAVAPADPLAAVRRFRPHRAGLRSDGPRFRSHGL